MLSTEEFKRCAQEYMDMVFRVAFSCLRSQADAEDVSHETLTAICNAVNIPVIAIGGITRDNVTELSGSGICGIAVISAIFAQKDIVSATKDLKEQTLRMLENK